MASLQRLDQIRDALIGRGIGTSGLTSQAIQRANLPTLGRELATSQGTLRNLQEQQTQQARASLLKATKPVAKPSFNIEDLMSKLPKTKQAGPVQALVQRTSTGGFQVVGHKGTTLGTPQRATRRFKTLAEVKQYLQSLGLSGSQIATSVPEISKELLIKGLRPQLVGAGGLQNLSSQFIGKGTELLKLGVGGKVTNLNQIRQNLLQEQIEEAESAKAKKIDRLLNLRLESSPGARI